MERLLEGYHHFRETEWPERRAQFETLAREGQSPQAMVIACSDSRVDPATIFGAGPGELFVLRNIANLVPPNQPDAQFQAAGAALEFAVRVLEVPHLIVMGHALCGGVRALLHGAPHPAGAFLMPWMRIAEPAKRRALACEPADPQTECEHEVVKLSLENLRSYPWVAERVDAGRLQLHGALFDMRSGVLSILQADGGFAPA